MARFHKKNVNIVGLANSYASFLAPTFPMPYFKTYIEINHMINIETYYITNDEIPLEKRNNCRVVTENFLNILLQNFKYSYILSSRWQINSTNIKKQFKTT